MADNPAARRLLSLPEPPVGPWHDRLAIEKQAQSRLRDSCYRQLHGVSCEFHEGVLTLRGCVSSYYLKQIAQTLIHKLDGVDEINNRLEVSAPRSAP